MTNTRIDRVTELVLETEQLRAAQAKIGESIADKEKELAELFGQAPPATTRTAGAKLSKGPGREAAPAGQEGGTGKRSASGAAKAAKKGDVRKPSIKDKVIGMLKEHPAGVELSILTQQAYGDADRAHRKLCEKNMYNLAKTGLVKHAGSLWSLVHHAS